VRLRLFLSGLVLLAGTTLAATPPAEETEHRVEEGETLNGIANRAGVPASRIIEANGLEEPYLIRIGQKLAIPREGRPASRSISARPSAPRVSDGASEVHVVEPGETLGGIALASQVPRVLIAEANGLEPPFTIRIGQKLVIPRTRQHTVESGDTGFGLAYRYAVPWSDIAVANGIEPDAPLRIGQQLLIPTLLGSPGTTPVPGSMTPTASATHFAWPLSGPIRRGWRSRNSRDYHDGLDIEAPEGTAVRASAAGIVIFAGEEWNQFGNLVVIDHGDGWHSAYGSLGRVTVQKGHKVTQGERVGLVGDTSITKRTELHFELRKGGKPVNPLDELPAAE